MKLNELTLRSSQEFLSRSVILLLREFPQNCHRIVARIGKVGGRRQLSFDAVIDTFGAGGLEI